MAKHLSPEERENISLKQQAGVPKAQIARELGRDRKTIFEEIRRNSVTEPYSGRRKYVATRAQQLADARKHKPRTKKMERPPIRDYVQQRLPLRWSPDQIGGRMKLEFPNNPQMRISHETIYGWIRNHDHRRKWQQCLRRCGLRKRRPPRTPDKSQIANRPAIVECRARIGDWEGDTIHGAGHSGGLLSVVERKSGYVLLAKAENLKSSTINNKLLSRLKPLPASCRQSVTFDNGSEFAGYKQLEEMLGMSVYFANPHSPWERGTNENTNGLARQFFPKGTSGHELSPAETARIQSLLNERPRKRLEYRTPDEVFSCCVTLARRC